MKYYKIYAFQEPRKHNPTDRSNLRNLEMSAKEVKCRKNCQCSICHRMIKKGEIALKTVQRVDSRREGFLYYNYCDECYKIMANPRINSDLAKDSQPGYAACYAFGVNKWKY